MYILKGTLNVLILIIFCFYTYIYTMYTYILYEESLNLSFYTQKLLSII